jgi:hypothetical protein
MTIENAVENLSRRFQTGGSFLMRARLGLKIQPRGRFLANEEVDD